jgi:hypothetical protein
MLLDFSPQTGWQRRQTLRNPCWPVEKLDHRRRRAPSRYGSDTSNPTVVAPRLANSRDMVPVPQPTSKDPVAGLDAGKVEKGLRQAGAPATHEVLINIRICRQERRQGVAHHNHPMLPRETSHRPRARRPTRRGPAPVLDVALKHVEGDWSSASARTLFSVLPSGGVRVPPSADTTSQPPPSPGLLRSCPLPRVERRRAGARSANGRRCAGRRGWRAACRSAVRRPP